MRKAALTLLSFVACALAANAQRWSILPQVGFENSKTAISYNDLSSFSPLGVKFSPQASLRLNYASKKGHGFFLGASNSRSTTLFSFTDPENGMNDFIATAGNMQLRLEGGYQFNSKPIALSKKSSSPEASTRKQCGASAQKSGCGSKSYSPGRCTSRTKSPATAKSSGSWMRIQPSVGIGYIPSVGTDVIAKTQNGQAGYEYRAGNWNTALIAGTGVEFGRDKTRLFTMSINYMKGIGNLNTQTITTQSGTKSVTTTLQSSVSAWNLRIGIPFTLAAKAKAKPATSKDSKIDCHRYRIQYRCRSI